MKASLLAIGRFKAGAERALFEQYNARLRPPLALRELPEGVGNPAGIRAREGAAIAAALPDAAPLVLGVGPLLHALILAACDEPLEWDERGRGGIRDRRDAERQVGKAPVQLSQCLRHAVAIGP